MSGPQTRVAVDFGKWAATVRADSIPPEILDHARRIWLDTIGCLLLGADHSESLALEAMLLDRERVGPVASTARRNSIGKADAILLNGFATGVNVFDDGHEPARGHIAGYILPGVLAEAEARGATLGAALASFVVGYEIAARIGAAARLRFEQHPSGTWGVVGAAAAIVHLRGGDAEQLTAAMELAANLTLTTSWDAAVHGASVRNLYSAMPSYLGLQAADLAQTGFRGGPSSIEITFGELSSPTFDAAACLAGLGRDYLTAGGYFKRYPCCRRFHAVIDTALETLSALPRPFDPLQDRVRVGTDMTAFKGNRDVHAESPLAARESLPVTIALALLHGGVPPEVYTGPAYAAPAVIALAERIEVEEAPRAAPDHRPGWTEIIPVGGQPVRRAAERPSGDAHNPLSEAELRTKFEANARAILGEGTERVAIEILQGSPTFKVSDVLGSWLGIRQPVSV